MSMTDEEKLNLVKSILTLDDSSEDEHIRAYLTVSEREILDWRFSYLSEDRRPEEVPPEYEMTQVYAVVAGYSQSGAENQTAHTENGIQRTFRHADMIDYIRTHVLAYVGVI